MTAHDRDRPDNLSRAVDLIRDGETVLALIDPAARGRDPASFNAWLQARLTIAELPRVILPGCDERCDTLEHRPDRMVVLSDVALDSTSARSATWWAGWNATLERSHQAGAIWFAGAPAMPLTPPARRLAAGTRLERIAITDPHWVTYDGAAQETLFRIVDGDLAGDSLVVVTFGHAPLLPALAGPSSLRTTRRPGIPRSRCGCSPRAGRPSSAGSRSRSSAPPHVSRHLSTRQALGELVCMNGACEHSCGSWCRQMLAWLKSGRTWSATPA